MKFTNEQRTEIVKAYIGGKSCLQVGKEFRCGASNVAGLLKTRKIPLRSREQTNRKHTFDYCYFDSIDSEEKAYWLGFIVAEGNVDRNTLSIQLGSKDKDHLKKLAEAINYSYFEDYDRKKNAYRLRLNSKYLVSQLSGLGICKKKCDKIVVPSISNDYLRHFFRGFVDGDGSMDKIVNRKKASKIVKQRNRGNCARTDKYTTLKINAASDCLQFLKDFKNWVNKILENNEGFIEKRFYKGKMRYKLIFCGNVLAVKVMNILYADCGVVMNRRKEKFLELTNGKSFQNCG